MCTAAAVLAGFVCSAAAAPWTVPAAIGGRPPTNSPKTLVAKDMVYMHEDLDIPADEGNQDQMIPFSLHASCRASAHPGFEYQYEASNRLLGPGQACPSAAFCCGLCMCSNVNIFYTSPPPTHTHTHARTHTYNPVSALRCLASQHKRGDSDCRRSCV